ncbi:hypothetical protein C4577_01145, partial [Candidatus Parcubacteria bacterium]
DEMVAPAVKKWERALGLVTPETLSVSEAVAKTLLDNPPTVSTDPDSKDTTRPQVRNTGPGAAYGAGVAFVGASLLIAGCGEAPPAIVEPATPSPTQQALQGEFTVVPPARSSEKPTQKPEVLGVRATPGTDATPGVKRIDLDTWPTAISTRTPAKPSPTPQSGEKPSLTENTVTLTRPGYEISYPKNWQFKEDKYSILVGQNLYEDRKVRYVAVSKAEEGTSFLGFVKDNVEAARTINYPDLLDYDTKFGRFQEYGAIIGSCRFPQDYYEDGKEEPTTYYAYSNDYFIKTSDGSYHIATFVDYDGMEEEEKQEVKAQIKAVLASFKPTGEDMWERSGFKKIPEETQQHAKTNFFKADYPGDWSFNGQNTFKEPESHQGLYSHVSIQAFPPKEAFEFFVDKHERDFRKALEMRTDAVNNIRPPGTPAGHEKYKVDKKNTEIAGVKGVELSATVPNGSVLFVGDMVDTERIMREKVKRIDIEMRRILFEKNGKYYIITTAIDKQDPSFLEDEEAINNILSSIKIP